MFRLLLGLVKNGFRWLYLLIDNSSEVPVRCESEAALTHSIADFVTLGCDVEALRKAMYCQVN